MLFQKCYVIHGTGYFILFSWEYSVYGTGSEQVKTVRVPYFFYGLSAQITVMEQVERVKPISLKVRERNIIKF